MIRTDKSTGVTALFQTNPRSSMTADVKKSMQLSIGAANNNDGLFTNLISEEITRIGKF
jgi:hypothetical protein